MTAERRKALVMMSITFLTGVIIGVLGTGFFARQHYHERPERKDGGRYRSERSSFQERIYRVVEADSAQRLLMKPIIDETSEKFNKLQEEGMKLVRPIFDSMAIKLKPILKPEQQEELQKYFHRHDKTHGGGEKSKEKD